MITRQDFRGAVLKIERANHHIEQLEAIVRAYVMENVKALRPEPNPNRWKKRSLGGRIPRHTPTIVGDAIHNLRTALDHAYCALVEANGGTVNRWTKFPFGDTRQNTEASLNGQKATSLPSAAVIKFILDEIKPFEAGGNDLYGVHKLDIADKHHVLIATNAVMEIQKLEILDAAGHPTGGGFENMTLVVPYGNQAGAIGLSNGMGAKLYGDPRATFDIRFNKGQPFEDESILKTLQNLWVITSHTIEALSKL
ncbi:hypothetical protein [Aquidulcibacter sp.]|jgi:hypothetical protein|uniref:hypothetical protein n=1 Tax=Aquidulcibacter sp. TaxID=2052990 RepID=UPI0037C03A4F